MLAQTQDPSSLPNHAMAKLLLGDKNTVVLSRSCDIHGERYLFGDELVVDEATARQLLEENVAELKSIAFSKGMEMRGPSISFRERL